MSRDEIIQLMDLLTLYIDDCKQNQKDIVDCETMMDFSTQVMISNHIYVAGQIKEVLCYKL